MTLNRPVDNKTVENQKRNNLNMKKLNYILVLIILFTNQLFAVEEIWDVIDKSMATWNQDGGNTTNKSWTYYKGTNIGANDFSITQGSGFVNLTKTGVGGLSHSVLINSQNVAVTTNTPYTVEFKARINRIDKTLFPDESGVGYESNLISARINKKVMDLYLRFDADEDNEKGTGYAYIEATIDPYEDDLYYLDVSEWHLYRFVLSADNTQYDVYIDGKLAFEGVSTIGMDSQTNILRFGANIRNRCNIDVEYAKMGTGDFNSQSRISTISISSDSHVEGNERTISVQAYTVLMDNDQKLEVSLVDENKVIVVNPIEFTVTNNIAQANFTIPASIPQGKYKLKVSVPGGRIGDVEVESKSFEYFVTDVSPLETKMFPQVKPVGFVIEMNDYIYKNSSNEFIFPSIVDTKRFTVDEKFLNGQEPIARYYLFYAPHENPGGMYLSTSPTLDGPWTEQNMVIDLNWAKAVVGSNINTADHISACQVIWNDEISKYIMYFHGPNSTTHYATSDNLKDWTFGASILTATQFAAGGKETSYAKVFEHEIPGLNNKYIIMAMVQENQIRRIYWAHSVDGLNWTPVRKPLIAPDLDYKKVPGTDHKPSYQGGFGNNVAAPALFVKDGRYFVFCHGSAGNMMVVEVGESFDMEIHWGEYMKAADVLIDTDNNGKKVAVPRVASPDFIQDDTGKWYMFFEAGSRLGANIAYAKEEDTSSAIKKMIYTESVSISGNLLNRGQDLMITSCTEGALISEVVLYTLTGNEISRKSVSNQTFTLGAPATVGIYLLSVRLDNNMSKEFKILVK